MPAHDNLRLYNCWDCVATVRAAKALRAELERNKQAPFWDAEVWPLVPAVVAMQGRGLLLDKGERKRLRDRNAAELAEVDELVLAADPTGKLSKPTGKSPNALGSPKAVATFLFDELKLKAVRRTKLTGKLSVNQDALLVVLKGLRKMDEHARPVLENLLHRSRLRTIAQRYFKVEPDPDGRVRPFIKMGGTETGRFAYDKPPLQQFPAEIRGMFVAAPGHAFVSADYSQLEARIAAVLAADGVDLEAFERGDDIHLVTAQGLFGVVDEAQRKAARNFAKAFRYGILYGGNPETMKTKTYCPCPRCEAKLPPTLTLERSAIKVASQRWFAQHPAILRWREALSEEVRTTRRLTNALGRRRIFFTPWPGPQREAYNWPIQSVAADIINRAMRRGHTEYGLRYVLQHHDSLVVEVPESEVDVRTAQLREVMEAPVPEMGGATFPVDVDVSLRWT